MNNNKDNSMLHTKTEWVSKLPFKFIFGNHLIETDQQVICRLMENDYNTPQEAKANARLIVTAVNNHHALVEALKRFQRLSNRYCSHATNEIIYDKDKQLFDDAKELLEKIESENNQQ
jgi:hypothetical protein